MTTTTRDPHRIVYHYADGVADILGLSTAQQIAIRTAMHLALREQASGYEATMADLATKIQALTTELADTWQHEAQTEEQEVSALTQLLVTVKTSEAPATISANGTHAVEHRRPLVAEPPVVSFVASESISFDAKAAQEAAAQPDPTPTASSQERKPFAFRWPTLDDKSLEIVQQLDGGKIAWRTLEREDKRIIVLATISELQMDMPPGQQLGLVEFDRRRPNWMSGFSSITQSLGRTWTQLLDAATRV